MVEIKHYESPSTMGYVAQGGSMIPPFLVQDDRVTYNDLPVPLPLLLKILLKI